MWVKKKKEVKVKRVADFQMKRESQLTIQTVQSGARGEKYLQKNAKLWFAICQFVHFSFLWVKFLLAVDGIREIVFICDGLLL